MSIMRKTGVFSVFRPSVDDQARRGRACKLPRREGWQEAQREGANIETGRNNGAREFQYWSTHTTMVYGGDAT